jgi:two-component system, NtrC family, response regulator HydG
MESVSTDFSSSAAKVTRPGTAAPAASEGVQGALSVLLVDDEPDMGLAAGDALRDAGHRVVVSTNGAEALELVTTQPFDVMICDIRLPKLDGLTLFRRTRQESPDTAVILMTAFGAVQDAVAAVKEGAHD